MVYKNVLLCASGLVFALMTWACQGADAPPRTQTHRTAVTAYCTATVNGVGQVDVETDYLPHVVQCENGGASFEALKAQAVAARSYLYYKLELSGSINDGTSDQVYSCGSTPSAQHIQAVNDTAGQVLTYSGITVCAFYVAGAVPSAADCVAVAGDNDYSSTEHYVTYNQGLSGNNITRQQQIIFTTVFDPNALNFNVFEETFENDDQEDDSIALLPDFDRARWPDDGGSGVLTTTVSTQPGCIEFT